jgi:hypothetical protein
MQNGLLSNPETLGDGAETLKLAEQRGDDYALAKEHARNGDVDVFVFGQ